MPPHDLLVSWTGMHWDAAKKSAFMEMARDLRLPASRSPEPAPKVVEECFQVPGTPLALAVYLSEAGNADRNGAFRWLFEAAEEAGIPSDTIHMGGSAVAGASLNREVLKSVWDASVPGWQIHRRSIILFSGLVGGVLSFWLLRSFKLAGLVLAVSYFTTLRFDSPGAGHRGDHEHGPGRHAHPDPGDDAVGGDSSGELLAARGGRQPENRRGGIGENGVWSGPLGGHDVDDRAGSRCCPVRWRRSAISACIRPPGR